MRITVVGGANTDIIGLPEGRFALRDSNPGHVRVTSGGVARNIAENLARMGADVRLVTAFGSDDAADALERECEAAGIDTSYCINVPRVPGSRYLAVLDERGDLAAAVNDMRALEALTPEAMDAAASAFADADAVVLDTNLPPSTIVSVAERWSAIPLVLDPVSTAKALRARPVLGRLAAIKPNLREAEEISGAAGAEGAAQRLLESGVGWVFVTLGRRGVFCASREDTFSYPAVETEVVNVTGAGDAFAAGVAYGVAAGIGLRGTVALASTLAVHALGSERTVAEDITPGFVSAALERAGR
jgi:pseudouridine kinase